MPFEAKTLQFEGPLDLMLHLISEHKLDILDLDMDVLADQYLSYLQQMEEKHLEIESEYLVELATLIEYKSKKLLPKREGAEEEEEDPKDVLVRRLLEYQRYKEAASELYEAYQSRQTLFSRPPGDAEDYGEEKDRLEGNPYDLLKAMSKVLKRVQLSKPIETNWTKREISLEDRELQLKVRLREMPEDFTLEQYLSDVKDSYEFVVSFLAILDLAKEHVLVFTVDEEERIWFRRGVDYEH